MQEKQRVLKELDTAIDAMDMASIERGLNTLQELEHQPVKAENVQDFAARIKNLNREDKMKMKPSKTMKVALVAAIVSAMGITAYAANELKVFSFAKGDKYVTVTTTEDMTQEEAEAMVKMSEGGVQPADADVKMMVEPDSLMFESVEQAEKDMDMNVILPETMPELPVSEIMGQKLDFGHVENRMLWITYGDPEERAFGLTVGREVVKSTEPVIGYSASDMDEGSLGSYTSKNGTVFTTLTESDDASERTAHIATVQVGEYEYTLVFFGFDDAERLAIIDSVDLSAYAQ